MRFILPLFLIIMLMPKPLWAEYFLRGRVIAVDREKGEITLSAPSSLQRMPKRPAPEPEKAPAEESPEEKIYIISADFIPPCAFPDHIIQVWGELSTEKENHLHARRITGPGWRRGKDSTGVRSRIRQRCFMPPAPPPPPPTGPDEP